MTAPALLIEFVRETRLYREPDVAGELPIVQNGPPGTFVVFADGETVPLPTDQIVFAEDRGGVAAWASARGRARGRDRAAPSVRPNRGEDP